MEKVRAVYYRLRRKDHAEVKAVFLAGKIHISGTTKDLLDQLGDYFVTPRGEVEIKVLRTTLCLHRTSEICVGLGSYP